MFLYSKVLGMQLPWMTEIGRPRVRRRLPVILSQSELTAIFRCTRGEHRLVAQLLYGTGMRLMEGLSLRVKDLDFAHLAVIVRRGKGRQGQGAHAAPELGSCPSRTAGTCTLVVVKGPDRRPRRR